MPEGHRRKLSLQTELGLTRRELLRRGAVVGGALVWVAPAVQSIRTPAFAQAMGQSPGVCAACYCWNGNADKTGITSDFCSFDGTIGFQMNRDSCENFCKSAAAPGGPFQHSEYCSGATRCSCSTARDNDATLTGVQCS